MSTLRYSNEQLFERLIAFVHKELPTGEVCMTMIADHLFLSTSQLNRRVKSVTGFPVSVFIMNLRIAKAQDLLTHSPNYSMADIARLCGFADTAHFSHSFRRKMGMSPTQYKNSGL